MVEGSPAPGSALTRQPADLDGAPSSLWTPSGLLRWVDELAENASGWLQSGPVCAAFILFFCLLHFVLRSWVFPGGTNDDAEQYLYSQSLSLGYQYGNPPLFTWLVLLVQQVSGQAFAAPQVIRALLLVLFFLGTYLAAREVTADRRYALAATMAPFTIYYVAFDAMRTYSHSVGLIAACMMTLALFLRLKRSGRLWLYLALGLALGLGLLSKYNFALFATGLLIASLLDSDLRARILDKRMLISLALALAIAGPNLAWLAAHASETSATLVAKLTRHEPLGAIAARLKGLFALSKSLIEILLPLLFLLPFCFPRSILPRQVDAVPDPENNQARAGQQFLGRFLGLVALLFVALILVGGFSHISNHYLLIFLPAPIWFFARASRIEIDSRGLHRFFALAMVLAVAATSAIVIKFLTDPLNEDRRPYNNVRYAAVAEGLKEAGFIEGSVYSFDRFYSFGGHLSRYLPDSRFLSRRHADYLPPLRAEEGQCLILWHERQPGPEPEIPSNNFREIMGIDREAPYVEGFVERPFANGWGASFKLSYRLYDEAVQRCR